MKYIFPALLLAALALVPYVWHTTQQPAASQLNEIYPSNYFDGAWTNGEPWHAKPESWTPPERFNWAIQGELSHLDCASQPGTHPWYNNVSPDTRFFMGCRHQSRFGGVGGFAPLDGAPPAAIHGPETSDPDAPPPSPELLAKIKSLLPHSTSEWKRFDTLHAAAIYAALRLENCSHYYECSGFISIDPKGKFAVSPARTDYISDSVNIRTEENPSDWKLAAEIHSHPCVPHHWTGLFSPEDMIGAITNRMVNYMVDLCTGDIHEFIPGVTKVDVTAIDDETYLSPGNVIGHVSVYKDEPRAYEGL